MTVHEAFWEVQKTAHLLQKNKEGDIGAQRGCQRALARDQVETFGCLDGTLLPPGSVLSTDSSCTVIRDHFPVAGGGKTQKAYIYVDMAMVHAGEYIFCHPDMDKIQLLLKGQ